MEALVKLSFYCFAAASVSLGAAAISYIMYTVGRVRMRQTALSTPTGTTVSATRPELVPGSDGAGR